MIVQLTQIVLKKKLLLIQFQNKITKMEFQMVILKVIMKGIRKKRKKLEEERKLMGKKERKLASQQLKII